MVVVAMAAAMAVACGNSSKETVLQDSIDSLSYVVGMNLAYKIMEMDSALRADKIIEGIRDVMGGEPRLSLEEGKFFLLSYMNYDVYERVKAFENQFLEDLRKADRKFVATSSGLTYKVHTLGDMKKVIRNNRDTILVQYRMLNVAGEVVDTTYYHGDTLRLAVGDMTRGVIEASKLIGEGGHIEAWVPSNLAFSSAGCDSLGVLPNTMLYYELWLIDVEKR
jgi:FKBP-type peptidyl-prolyl cis-trans isomerase